MPAEQASGGGATRDPRANGVLPSQMLAHAIDQGWIGGPEPVPASSVQPASVDLRLGEVAYRIRCSFLPDADTVENKLKAYRLDALDLTGDGALLERNCPYLIPLTEELALPAHVRGRTNPKSSTGRLDVFTRVITDRSYRFDEIRAGYEGRLWLEVVPLSFMVRVRQGLALNQLRLIAGRASLTDDELRDRHRHDPLLFRGGQPLADEHVATADGLFLSLDLFGPGERRIGWRAREHAGVLDMALTDAHGVKEYWEPVHPERGNGVVLAPGRFYLLLSDEAVAIPPDLAAEMTAYDPTSGELRTHYAGFFDPGFGHDPEGRLRGSRAALEVRAHDVPFMIEHGQRICKLTFERMLAVPDRLYGTGIGSSYQGQEQTLGKHFKRPAPDSPGERRSREQPELFP